jgi:ABC-type Fe3+-siderophore transport system permease subunit
MRGFSLILFVSLAVSGASLDAQDHQLLKIGEFVRITAPALGLDRQVARYLRLYRDTLTVQAGRELDLPIASVTLLEVSRGISNRPTLVGIAAGAVAGVVVGIAVAPDEDSEITGGARSVTALPQPISSDATGGSHTLSGAAVGPIAGALIGAFVGGLVGKGFRRHRWEEIPLDRLRVSIVPQWDGFVAGMKLAFQFNE